MRRIEPRALAAFVWCLASCTLASCTLASCTMVASFPDTRPEASSRACTNGVDDDLNGRLDCAEESCAEFCPVAADVRPVSLSPCYADAEAARDVSFPLQLGTDPRDTRCAPWALDGAGNTDRPSCDDGKVIFPGELSCAALGDGCPEPGMWPVGLPANTLYVRVDAPGAHTGTDAEPFASVAQALAVATPGDTIILGEGLYQEAIEIGQDITLRGVCADAVYLWSDAESGVVRMTGAGASLVDVTVGSGLGAVLTPVAAGIRVEATGVKLESVAVAGVDGDALTVAAGASLTAERVDIRQLRGTTTAALVVEEGAQAELHALAVQAAEGDAVRVAGELLLEASWVSDVEGVAYRVEATAQTYLRGAGVIRALGAVLDVDCGGRAEACAIVEDLWADAAGGSGVRLRAGSMNLTRALIQRADDIGVHVLGGTLTVADVAIARAGTGETTGAGVRVESGGKLQGTRVFLQRNQLYALDVLGGTIQLANLSIDGAVALGTGNVGMHIVGGTTSLQGFWIDKAGICGMELEDVHDAVFAGGVISGGARGVCIRGGSLTAGQLMSSVTITSDIQRPIFVETE